MISLFNEREKRKIYFLKFKFLFFFIFFNFTSSSLGSVSLKEDSFSLSLKEKILETKKKERNHLSDLYEINQEIKKIRKKKNYYFRHFLLLEKKAQKIAKEVLSLDQKQNEKRKLLQASMKDLYRRGDKMRLKILFSIYKIMDLDRNFKYLKKILEKSKEQILDYQETKKLHLSKQKSLKETLRRFLIYKNKMAIQEKKLLSVKNEKYKILKTLRKEKKYYLKNLKKSKLKNNFYEDSFFDKKGLLRAPILGHPVRDYKISNLSPKNFQFKQSGIFYKISSDTFVRSVYNGHVVFAGPLEGYGNLLILDHGDQYYSIYANLSYFLVKKGDRVSELQKIAKIKPFYYEKLRSKESGLYFEIRHFSDPLDPKEWIH